MTTVGVVISEATATMTQILSLLLPLKVILLAASPGVPRYFPFIDPADKTIWIIGLSLAAVFFYLITLILEALTSRMSEDAGQEILYRANDLTLLKNQDETVRGYFSSFCGISSSLLFLGFAFLILFILNFWLFMFMVLMIIVNYLFTAWALGGRDIGPGPLKSYILDKTNNYLKITTSLTFLAAFFIILAPFLMDTGGNIIIAILSILLLRRSLNFFVSSTKEITRLCGNKHQINALIFPEIKIEKPESKDTLAVRDIFQKSARQINVQKELENIISLSEPVEVQWMDPTASGLYMFFIKAYEKEEESPRFFQKQAFPSKSLQLFENEDYLFTQVSRKELKAPTLISRYTQEPFVCQILDYGQGSPVPAKKWNALHDDLIEHYWSIQPPASLIRAYSSSHKLPHEILCSEFINRVEIAVDTTEERNILHKFHSKLFVVNDILKAVPLYIFNPEITVKNHVQSNEDHILVMTWGKWSLEPLGAVMPHDKKRIDQAIKSISKIRKDVPENFDQDHLYFVFNCRRLGNEINREAYKAALGTMAALLENTLFNK